MKLGDNALAVVSTGYKKYETIPVVITGVMETLKKVTNNGKTEKYAEKNYRVEPLDTDNYSIIDSVSSENIFPIEEKEEAKTKCNALMGITPEKQKQIEEYKYKEAKEEFDKLKNYLKTNKVFNDYTWTEDVEDTIIKLLKDNYLTLNSNSNKIVNKQNTHSIFDFDPFESWENDRRKMNRRLERLLQF